MGPRPEGPWQYGGTILSKVSGLNVHHSIVEWRDRWVLFFHLWPPEGPGQRRVYAEYLDFDANGNILPVQVTAQGLAR